MLPQCKKYFHVSEIFFNVFMYFHAIILSSLILCLVGDIFIGSLQLQVDQLYFLTSISTHITNPVDLLI